MRFTIQVLFIMLIIGVVLFATSCQYAEITDFVHNPTHTLPKQPRLSSPKLASYRLGDIVCAPRVMHLNHQSSKVDLLLYSEKPLSQPVLVKKALLRAYQTTEIARMTGEKKVTLNPDSVNKGMLVGGVVLMGNVQDATLKNASRLDLILTVDVGGEQKEITFVLDQRVRKYHVQR